MKLKKSENRQLPKKHSPKLVNKKKKRQEAADNKMMPRHHKPDS